MPKSLSKPFVADAALLRTILERPEDDAPRLVYADWLDEHGDEERAEFIRVQCELARPRQPSGLISEREWLAASNGYEALAEDKRELALRRRVSELSWGCREWSGLRQPWSIWYEPATVVGDGPHAIFNRGWVAEIRLSLAAFVGGPCGRCHGDGGITEREPTPLGHRSAARRCPVCKGERTVPGLAADLFARQPVQTVVLTDRRARPDTWSSVDRSFWFHGDDPARGGVRGGRTDPACLPVELFDLLDAQHLGGTHWFEQFGRHSDKIFPTRDAADAALSAACVAYGRGLAGLG